MLWLLFIGATELEQVAKMRAAVKPMLKLQEEAAEKKDAVRGQCVVTRLNQVKGLLRIAEQSEVALAEAQSKKDSEVAAHELHKIDLAAAKVAKLLADARACVGEQAHYSGDTQVLVKFTGDAKDPTVMTIFDLLQPPLLLRPFQVSPYQ